MFKILILQRYYNLSDDQTEHQINDRMSFMHFLNLNISDDVPDSKTIWHFSERLSDLGLVKEIFDLFAKELESLGLIVNERNIIDASFVETQPNKKNQKDIDARWTKRIINLIMDLKITQKQIVRNDSIIK